MDDPRSDPPLEPDELDDQLLERLERGDDAAFEALMERWGDAVIDTCFRALEDARRAFELYGEVWAEVYVRTYLGPARRPRQIETWLVGLIAELLDQAAADGSIPSVARRRMRLAPVAPSPEELSRIDELRDGNVSRQARNRLPREFSAAADLMLLRMPPPSQLSRVQPSARA